ncbi:hypothetical protein KIN20_003215 [Parelaphostrongylus tenuis]|uniref:Uncharacterized protein n=1 Tax=Parelaphostrongylus tenuis TaxID=148309 RepID=A0AAD5MFC1_PARTN|nr:hypothetical protein KIN20_003215 [Parelaphostrongylus tenuis]
MKQRAHTTHTASNPVSIYFQSKEHEMSVVKVMLTARVLDCEQSDVWQPDNNRLFQTRPNFGTYNYIRLILERQIAMIAQSRTLQAFFEQSE